MNTNEKFSFADISIELNGLSIKGGPNKKFNEDGFAFKYDPTNAMIMVVDGGTQVEQIPTLKEISGGKYIRDKAIEFASQSNSDTNPLDTAHEINRKLGNNISQFHPSISFKPDSLNTPYGSLGIASINNSTVSTANAGDVFILGIKKDNVQVLLTKDGVFKKDQQTLKTAADLAAKYRISVREVMELRDKDPRFEAVMDEMYKTVKMGNSGEIRRLSGAPNFDVTYQTSIPIALLSKLYLFSDGAIPHTLDIHTSEGQQKFCSIIEEKGIDGLYQTVVNSADSDPDFNKYPRFRHIDDFTIVELIFNSIIH